MSKAIEKITKFVKFDNDNLGYEIHTNKQVISLQISNSGNCCESWGLITTEDTLSDFVGAKLLGIELVDMDYKSHPLTMENVDFNNPNNEGTSFCFIDINTSKGKLQFVLYNTHNGYYGHSIEIKSNHIDKL